MVAVTRAALVGRGLLVARGGGQGAHPTLNAGGEGGLGGGDVTSTPTPPNGEGGRFGDGRFAGWCAVAHPTIARRVISAAAGIRVGGWEWVPAFARTGGERSRGKPRPTGGAQVGQASTRRTGRRHHLPASRPVPPLHDPLHPVHQVGAGQ